MSTSPAPVVLIDDDEGIGALLSTALGSRGIQLVIARNGGDGLAAVQRVNPALVLLDLKLPDVTDLSLLENILANNLSTEVVVITGDHSMASTVGTARRGALDYITKPFDVNALSQRVEDWLDRGKSGAAGSRELRAALNAAAAVGIVGQSAALQDVIGKISRIGPHFRNALITGPTGSGKEVVARLLHRMSGASGPFAVFNCAAVPETLFESELFGHVKGAFTGAVQDRVGIAEYAAGGTLFIDEIGELAPALQAVFLRLLQNRELRRVGSTSVRNLDIRIIAATNQDLRKMVECQSFREDLFHRLSTVSFEVPGLAERRDDIAPLTEHFLRIFCSRYGKPLKALTARAHGVLSSYSWPGNIRELESVMDYCCLMCISDRIDVGDLPMFVQTSSANALLSLEEMEQKHLQRALKLSRGNRDEAAAALGIGRATVYRMLTDAKKTRMEARSNSGEGRTVRQGSDESYRTSGPA